MEKQGSHSEQIDTRQAEASQDQAGPVLFGGQPRYCMRCGKRYATHIKLGNRGRKQYRCDECFEGRSRP